MAEKMTLSVREAAAVLGVSHTHIRNHLLLRKDFPAFRIGNRWVISRVLLDEWISSQCKDRSGRAESDAG